jgi:diguanylate cyclase (GGDEF)-like protein/PAS domain S-box-containing protein
MEMGVDSYIRILENLNDGLYFVDRNRTITYWNKAAEQISGYSASEVIGRHCGDNILNHVDAYGNSLCTGLCPLAKSIEDGNSRSAEVYLHHKQGHRIPVSVRTSLQTDALGHVVGGIELFTDISNQQANSLRLIELEKLAMKDALTGLANRAYFDEVLFSKVEEFKRYKVPFGLIFLDIDNFRDFNNNWGHQAGDAVLKYVSSNLIYNSRPFDTFGRWGGEEFVGLIPNIELPQLEKLSERLRLLIESSYLFYKGEKLRVTASFGATVIEPYDTADSILARVDALLYMSKDAGRNRLSVA